MTFYFLMSKGSKIQLMLTICNCGVFLNLSGCILVALFLIHISIASFITKLGMAAIISVNAV